MKKRILIVDPDQQMNKINEKILTSSGIVSELHITCNGKEAIEYLKARVDNGYPLPHVIIFEIDMPFLNGFGFVEGFQKLEVSGKKHIQLVVFTASSSPKDRLRMIGLGIRHYLNKPYLLRGLRDIIMHSHSELLEN